MKSDKIGRLEVDVISITDRLNRHSEKIDRISDNNLVLETILKRLEDDSVVQKQTNAEMNKTMLSIQGAMSEITYNIRELNTRLVSTDKKISSVSDKVEEIDEKSKVDFLEIIKAKIVPFLFGGGFIYAIVEIFKNIQR